jgi:hypothetical protein
MEHDDLDIHGFRQSLEKIMAKVEVQFFLWERGFGCRDLLGTSAPTVLEIS